ncbi:MAG: hypothetical protein H7Y27_01560 [Gemmatimonadaceae bacterium]|nr:hypothetical protein [Chitinophagaceae bacterium]
MKKSILFFAMTLTVTLTNAQGVFSNQTNGTLEKVIRDYPNNFKNLRGDLLVSNRNSSKYQSVLAVPGSVSNTITSLDEGSVSWQSELFKSADFEQASSRFKELFGQIKNTIVKIESERPVILNGRFDSPSEARSTNTVSFDMLPSNAVTSKLKVDLILEKIESQWRVVLRVSDSQFL